MPGQPPTCQGYPVFKGLGRKPTFMGVPTTHLFGSLILIGSLAMLAGLAWWALLIIILPGLAWLTRHDDKALDVLWLETITRGINRNKTFWKGSSYAPLAYPPQRPWLQHRRPCRRPPNHYKPYAKHPRKCAANNSPHRSA